MSNEISRAANACGYMTAVMRRKPLRKVVMDRVPLLEAHRTAAMLQSQGWTRVRWHRNGG